MAKKKLIKTAIEEGPIEYGEEVDEPIEDFEEEEGLIDVPEDLMSDSVFQEEDIPPTTSKTFFDFTYKCCHSDNGHCIECYNKARKG